MDINSDQFIISKPCGFIGSFFDPLGLALPIVTRAKEFLQKVWQLNLNWDIPLPSQILLPWNSFFQDLMSTKPIPVKRELELNKAESNIINRIF